jgi:hypothetical protein
VWLQFLQWPISVRAMYGLSVGGHGFLLLVHFFCECEWEHKRKLFKSNEDEDKGVGEWC